MVSLNAVAFDIIRPRIAVTVCKVSRCDEDSDEQATYEDPDGIPSKPEIVARRSINA